jgi:hypothetical protein
MKLMITLQAQLLVTRLDKMIEQERYDPEGGP